MSRFKPYPKYKDSGVEWLGQVPEHWDVIPLKRAIAAIESGTSVNAADTPAAGGQLGVLKTSCVYSGSFNWRENKSVIEEDIERVSCPLKVNTLIVSRMNTPELVGAAGLVRDAPEGIFLPDRLWQISFGVNDDPEFYYHFTRTSGYRDQVKMSCAGTSASMQNLSQEDFLGLVLAKPSSEEQSHISIFLNHETAKIDTLIAEQQRLIQLLKEKRQAVISHAVTKGLDPTVPMKDSGVEWLGQVPAHWVVKKLGLVTLEKCDGPFGSALKSEHYTETGIRVIRLQNIKSGWFNDGDAAFIGEEYFESSISKSGVLAGDLLIAGLGDDNNPVGRACVAPENIGPAMVKADCFRFRLNQNEVMPGFMAEQLSAGAEADAGELATGSTRSRIPLSAMSTRLVAIPPKREQQEILTHLESLKSKFNRLLDESLAGIRNLEERRAAIISAAVTGKIDLRDWQPPTTITITSEATHG